jgi:hypothetical protein
VGLRYCRFSISQIGESEVERIRDKTLASINHEGHMAVVI